MNDIELYFNRIMDQYYKNHDNEDIFKQYFRLMAELLDKMYN